VEFSLCEDCQQTLHKRKKKKQKKKKKKEKKKTHGRPCPRPSHLFLSYVAVLYIDIFIFAVIIYY